MPLEEEPSVESDVGESRISRGEKAEVVIEWEKVDQCVVYDEHDKEYRFGDLCKDQTTIVIFIRNFLCFMCKEYMDDLAQIPIKHLSEQNVRLLVIACAPTKFIKPFRAATGYKYILMTDPERNLYRHLGFYSKTNIKTDDEIRPSKHVKSGYVMGVLKSMWRGMGHNEMQGDMNQQGGSLIIKPGQEVVHYHKDKSPCDHAPINDLLCLTGVPQVNFENDRRVMAL